jgi:hypothetical protein
MRGVVRYSLAALPALLSPPASAKGLEPMAADGVVAAISDCVAATERNGINEGRLTQGGWQKASLTGGGDAAKTPMGFYSRPGSNALVMSHATLCIVTAELEQAKQYQAVVDGIDSLEGVRAIEKDKLKITFMSPEHLIQSEMVGSNIEPIVKIFVGAVPEKK